MIGRSSAAVTIRDAADAIARVVVEDGQRERLQHDRLGERRLHDQDRRAGEVAVAFPVAPDVPAEPVGLQVAQRPLVHDPAVAQERELPGAEP